MVNLAFLENGWIGWSCAKKLRTLPKASWQQTHALSKGKR
jgi:hypothetical protein